MDKALWRAGRGWCYLDEFVAELFGSSLSELVPEEYQSEGFQALCKSKLLFTSFQKIHKRSYELTEEDFRGSAERLCAVVAQDYTWGVDQFILDVKGNVVVQGQAKIKKSDNDVAGLAKESPPFSGAGRSAGFLSLHMNVLDVKKGSMKVVDPREVEAAVRENKSNRKVLQAALDSLAGEGGENSSGKRKRGVQETHGRLFQAWTSWLLMPRKNQVIIKANGLGCFKDLLGDDLFHLLREMAGSGWPLFDLSKEFELLQMDSVSSMCPLKNLI